ncbi:MAG: hypothetical protein ABJE47_24525 [bacterium]
MMGRGARQRSLRAVTLTIAVAFAIVATASTLFVVSLSSSVRRSLDRGTDQLMIDQRIADQIVSSSYGQQLAAFRYLKSPSPTALGEFRVLGQETYAHIRQYLFRPMPLTARLKVELIKEAHQTFEVAAQHAFDLSLRNDPDDARQQVLALTECASR